MTTQTLKSKALTGMSWNAIEKITVQGINFGIGILLARILSPSDYGLIGMLAIFFGISVLFVESGFSSALIQKNDRTDDDFSTVFYFNILVALLLYFLLFISAPLIADFYKTPQLTLLTRVLSLNIIINSLSIVQNTKLIIELNFKIMAKISLISVVFSGTTGIIAAYSGLGVWSLVIQASTSAIVRTCSLYLYNKWIPKFIFSTTSFKRLFGFSSKLLIASFVATIVNNLYSICLGKIFTAKDVGFYEKSKSMSEQLSGTVTSVLQSVTYPILASLQDNRERMVSVYSRLLGMTTFFVIPSMTLFALISEPVVRFLLTDKWMTIVPLIQWLCFARMITPISVLNLNILNAMGRSDLFLKVDLSKLPMSLGALAITVSFGLKAVVVGHFITSFIAFFINAYYPGKLFGYGPIRQLKDMKYIVLSTIFMAGIVCLCMNLLQNDLLKLIVCPILGIISYIAIAYLFKIKELDELLRLVKQMSVKFRKKTNGQ